MNEYDLRKRSEELEQTLQKQLEILKKDSEIWIKFGGAAIIAGLVSYTVVRAGRGKRKKGAKQDYPANKKSKSSFFSGLRKRVFLALLAYGKIKLIEELTRRYSASET